MNTENRERKNLKKQVLLLFQKGNDEIKLDFDKDQLDNFAGQGPLKCDMIPAPPSPTTPPPTAPPTTTRPIPTTQKPCYGPKGKFTGNSYAMTAINFIGSLKKYSLNTTIEFSAKKSNGLILFQGTKVISIIAIKSKTKN